MQPKSDQQGTNRRIRCVRVARTEPDTPKLCKRDCGSLGNAGERDSCRRSSVLPSFAHERHLPVPDFGELLLSPTALPLKLIVLVERDVSINAQVQRIPLQPERPRLGSRWLPAHDLGHPGSGVLRVLPLLAQMRLPEAVQQGLREPGDQRAAGLGRRAEDRLPKVRLDEVHAIQLRVSQVGICIAVGELQAGEPSRKVRRQVAQFREVQNELRNRSRHLPMPPEGGFEAVRL